MNALTYNSLETYFDMDFNISRKLFLSLTLFHSMGFNIFF